MQKIKTFVRKKWPACDGQNVETVRFIVDYSTVVEGVPQT